MTGRRRTASDLMGELEATAVKPSGQEQEEKDTTPARSTPRPRRRKDRPVKTSERTPAATGERIQRTAVRVPATVRARLARHARLTGQSMTAVVLDAYRRHVDQLPREPEAAAPGGPLALPTRTLDASGRRLGIDARTLVLSLYPAEREVLVRAVEAGKAVSLSDLVTQLIELELPPRTRRGKEEG